jgi:hypothetical protein
MTDNTTKRRYEIYPIADGHMNSVRSDILVATADTPEDAWKIVHGDHPHFWGCGILDTETGLFDFGLGFGVVFDAMGDDDGNGN